MVGEDLPAESLLQRCDQDAEFLKAQVSIGQASSRMTSTLNIADIFRRDAEDLRAEREKAIQVHSTTLELGQSS